MRTPAMRNYAPLAPPWPTAAILAAVLACWAALVGGCARFPSVVPPPVGPARKITAEATVAGSINPAYYYFLALDTDGDNATGPVPDATGLGNGWGVIAPTAFGLPVKQPPCYVVYHNGSFEQYRDGVAMGAPFSAAVDGARITVVLDAATVAAVLPAQVELNWITQQELTVAPEGTALTKSCDGLGARGNDYLDTLRLDTNQTRVSGEPGMQEELRFGESYGDGAVENTTDLADLDIVGWRVEIRVRPGG